MRQHSDDTPENLRILSNVLDYAGYESVLLVYHSLIPDYMIRVANIINKEHKLKYMFAVRTYSVSPEYCAMMCKAFDMISKNRIILNIAAGDLKNEETSIDDVVAIKDLLDTYEKRVEYTYQWLEKFTSLEYLNNKPEIVVSGTSLKTISNSEKYADAHLAMRSSYLEGLKVNTKRRIAACRVIVRDSNEEAEELFAKEQSQMMKDSTIFGTEEEVINKIKKMNMLGITDVLISRHPDDDQEHKIHAMTKRFLEMQSANL